MTIAAAEAAISAIVVEAVAAGLAGTVVAREEDAAAIAATAANSRNPNTHRLVLSTNNQASLWPRAKATSL